MQILSIRDINQKAERLYELMLQDMELCRRKQLEPDAAYGCLYKITNGYLAILRDEISIHEFVNEEEEIVFRKTIQPKFLSEQIFCGLERRARLTMESEIDKQLIENFRDSELFRLAKFKIIYADFYEYYKSGRTDKDADWFSGKTKLGEHDIPLSGSTQDMLISQLMALERYGEYLEKL